MKLKKIVAASALTLAAATGANAQVSGDVIKIGIITDMSGLYSDIDGAGGVEAIKMAVADMGGAVGGKKVEVVFADHQNKADVAAAKAREWFDTAGVDMLIGGTNSGTNLAMAKVAAEKKKLFIAIGAATSALTNEQCNPYTVHWAYDTVALAKGTGNAVVKQGGKSWYFLTADYAFGAQLQNDTTKVVEAAGGKVVGSVKHPLGATDYSSYLLQAQSSGAKAIVILNAGLDLSNALKQAAEFRIAKGGQAVSVFGMTINSVAAMGQATAAGLNITVPFYWDHDDASRAWSKRFMDRNNGVVPTYIMAGVYSAVTHYLKAVQSSGTDAGPAVVAKMKATPINDFMSKDVKIREDGQVMRPVYAVEVKAPAQSKSKFDFYTIGGTIPAEQVFRPLSEGGCDFVKK